MLRRLSLILVLACAAALPVPAPAQQAEEDKGFLVRTLQDALSGAGRAVQIEGFRGALSSSATLDELTVADDAGVWLTLRDVALDWERGALLRGAVRVTALTAGEILLARLPQPEQGTPAPEAGTFRLPDLPVSVEIGQIAAARVELGAPVLGEAVTLGVQGALALVSGRATAELAIERIDNGPAGRVALDLDFDGAAQTLALDLSVEEAAGGIAGRLLGVPDEPSVALTVAGQGPLDDFTARLRLLTDGAERLAGTLSLRGAEAGARRFAADLSGDVTALFAPDLRGFFGPQVALRAEGARAADGAIALDAFDLSAASLSLRGAARLGPDGFPEMLSLDGRLAHPGGGPVRLPIGGPPALVDEAGISLAFDAAQGPGWVGRFIARGFRRDGLATGRLVLGAEGEIARGTPPAPLRRVSARLNLAAEGLDLGDPALAGAFGQDVTGGARLAWQEGAPLSLSDVRLAGRDYALALDGRLSDLAAGIRAEGTVAARIDRLAAFSGLAGRPLSGQATLDLSGSAVLATGAFDLAVTGRTRDLALGEEVADALIGGVGRLDASAVRGGDGLRLRHFRLETAGVTAEAEGRLATGDADIRFTAAIPDVARALPDLPGAARLSGRIDQTGPEMRLTVDATGPGGATATASGMLTEPGGRRDVAGRIEATLPDLSRFARLAGMRLSGQARLEAEGSGSLSTGAFEARADATTQALAIGQPGLDRLIGGAGRLSVAASGSGDGAVTLRRAALSTPGLSAAAQGTLRPGASVVTLDARVTDVARLTPDLSGPLSLSGRVAEDGEDRLSLDLDLAGPGGSTGRLAGQVPMAPDGRFDLTARGRLPLALADAALGVQGPRLRGPLDFDLALRGAPEPGALSGQVSTTGGRVLLPAAGIVLEALEARAGLAGGRATLRADARVQEGGSLSASGDLALAPDARFPGSIDLRLDDVALRQRGLYRTTLSGDITARGPLAGGATIAGRLGLGPTELRIPSGLGGAGDIPDIRHVNEPEAARATRARAGLIAEPDAATGGGGGGPVYPLDLLIEAPRQVFLRGRGLDAELGGRIALGGTTAAPLPSGRFELIRGRLDLLGKRLDLTEGSATLSGDFNPEVRLVAESRATDGTLGRITVSGEAENPEITFSSEPDLPQDEVLARLFFGSEIAAISPIQAAQLASAVATLAGGGNGTGLVGSLRGRAGLDDLDIGTSEDGAATARAGKYISERVYTDVEVGSDGRSTLSINLDVTDDLRARGRVNTESEGALGLFYERDY